MEEMPLFINKDEDHLGFLSETDENIEINEISNTKYIPGARWLYSKYRSDYLKIFKLSYMSIYLLELFLCFINISKSGFNPLHISCPLGLSIIYFSYSKSLASQNFLLNRIGIKAHILSIGMILYMILNENFITLGLLLSLSSALCIWNFILESDNFAFRLFFNLLCLRISIIFDYCLFKLLDFCVIKIWISREIMIGIIQLAIITSQNVHIAVSFCGLNIYVYINNINDVMVEKSLIITVIISFIVLLFKLIPN